MSKAPLLPAPVDGWVALGTPLVPFGILSPFRHPFGPFGTLRALWAPTWQSCYRCQI